MADPLLIRSVALFGPILVTFGLWFWSPPDRRLAAGALLASLWNLPTLWVLNLLAERFGWWRFTASGGVLLGQPVDLWLGWTLLWGALPSLGIRRRHLALTLTVM